MSDEQAVSHAPTPLSRLSQPVLVCDRSSTRTHRTEDLVDFTISAAAIAFVLVLGVYAHGTTSGVTEDVRSALGGVLRQILLLPLTLLESIFVLAAPISVVVSLALRRRLRTILEAILTGVLAAILTSIVVWSLPVLPEIVTTPLTISTSAGKIIVIDLLIATLAAFFTVAGEASQMRTIRYSWAFTLVLALLYVLRGSITLPAALISILFGRLIGTAGRYGFGFRDDRASAIDLVDGLLHIGITPVKIVRTDVITTDTPLEAVYVIEESQSRSTWASPFLPLVEDAEAASVLEPNEIIVDTLQPSMTETDRHYVCWDTNGSTYDLIVLDPDTQVTGLLHDLWNNIRLRGLSRWLAPSLQASAERSALVKVEAHKAGVTTPEVVAITAAGGSVFTVQKPIASATYLTDLPAERLTDEILVRFFTELKIAHRRGISHRNIDHHALALDTGDRTWITDWDQGQVATTGLNRRIDLAQMITALALKVGPERSLAAAREVFDDELITFAAPVLQKAILPLQIRRELRRDSDVLSDLRQEMLGELPAQDLPDLNLQRFSPKTVIMAVIAVVALWAVLGSLNFQQVEQAVRGANPWWIILAFVFGLLTYLGAALPLVAFTPERLRLSDVTLVQVGASVVTLVAPAGIGPAALNLRFLNKRGVDTPLALATVALVQFTQFVTTVAMLLLIVLVTGHSTGIELPSNTILYAVGIVTVVIGSALAVPWVRDQIWKRLEPSWNQIWQRLVWALGHPRRLLVGIGGNLLMTVSFILAFAASLAAFGYSMDPTTLTITYLASNSLGSVVPSPGGIGPVEAALTAGLSLAGIPSGVAISTALLYRLVTFYGRAPLGWIALRIMQKRDLI